MRLAQRILLQKLCRITVQEPTLLAFAQYASLSTAILSGRTFPGDAVDAQSNAACAHQQTTTQCTTRQHNINSVGGQ
jgi:hypothetical protein